VRDANIKNTTDTFFWRFFAEKVAYLGDSERLFHFHAGRTIWDEGEGEKILLLRPAHRDENPERISLVRLTTEDDKLDKASCDHGRSGKAKDVSACSSDT
jgi:hypothetical protein